MPIAMLNRVRCLALAAPGLAVAAEPTLEPLDACFFAPPDDPRLPRPGCGYVVTPESTDRPERPIRVGTPS